MEYSRENKTMNRTARAFLIAAFFGMISSSFGQDAKLM